MQDCYNNNVYNADFNQIFSNDVYSEITPNDQDTCEEPEFLEGQDYINNMKNELISSGKQFYRCLKDEIQNQFNQGKSEPSPLENEFEEGLFSVIMKQMSSTLGKKVYLHYADQIKENLLPSADIFTSNNIFDLDDMMHMNAFKKIMYIKGYAFYDLYIHNNIKIGGSTIAYNRRLERIKFLSLLPMIR